jgi:hypothetical protein
MRELDKITILSQTALKRAKIFALFLIKLCLHIMLKILIYICGYAIIIIYIIAGFKERKGDQSGKHRYRQTDH